MQGDIAGKLWQIAGPKQTHHAITEPFKAES